MTPGDVLKNFYNKLNQFNDFHWSIDFFRPSNVVDFVLEGEVDLVPRALRTYLNASIRVEITCVVDDNNCLHLNVDLIVEGLLDFTRPEMKPVIQNISSFLIDVELEEKVVNQILIEVRNHKEGLLRPYKASSALRKIVGKETLRYKMLTKISHHLQKNCLVTRNGSIKIDSSLRPLFRSENVVLANEECFFATLRRNIEKI